MSWIVKLIIVVALCLVQTLVYAVTRDHWKWSDRFFLYVPFVVPFVLWPLLGFWCGVVYFFVWLLLKGYVRPAKDQRVFFVDVDDMYYMTDFYCSKCRYDKIEMVRRFRGGKYNLNKYVETYCPRCHNHDIFEYDNEVAWLKKGR